MHPEITLFSAKCRECFEIWCQDGSLVRSANLLMFTICAGSTCLHTTLCQPWNDSLTVPEGPLHANFPQYCSLTALACLQGGNCNPDLNQRRVTIMVSDVCEPCSPPGDDHIDLQALTFLKVTQNICYQPLKALADFRLSQALGMP